MTGRRRFLAAGAALGLSALVPESRAQRRVTIDVKSLGAAGSGKVSDLEPIRTAVETAARYKGGANVYFPPGEYYLGTANEALLIGLSGLDDVRLIGDDAALTCRSLRGSSSILFLGGCRNVSIEGLTFRDYGLRREIDWLGAAAVRIANEGETASEGIDIRNCRFESVLSAVVCRSFDGLAGCRGIRLQDLVVKNAYYGFSFQDAGDDVVGRALRCSDVKRSYFPYGIANHDIELETSDNATGYTDVLIKCYHKDTTGIRARIKCRGKRSGDAIVAFDHQHEFGRGTMRDLRIDLDLDEADCRLDTVFLIRSFNPKARVERSTGNRWDNITIDGDVRICDRTKLLDIVSVSRTPGRLTIGPRLAQNPRLPQAFPGFVVGRGKGAV